MDPLTKTVVITGASDGIGYELAKCFAQDHYQVIAIGRDQDKLSHLVSEIKKYTDVPVISLAIDLSKPNAAETVIKEMINHQVTLDTIVNNVGVGLWGDFESNSIESIDEQMGLLRNSLVLTRYALQDMTKKKNGEVLFVGSVYAFTPVPHQSIYSAVKSFFLSFSQSLGIELKENLIKVSILCPGITDTAFRLRAGIVDKRGSWLSMTAQEVAVAGYQGLKKGKPVVIPGVINKCYVMAAKCFPTRLLSGSLKWLIYKLRGLTIAKQGEKL